MCRWCEQCEIEDEEEEFDEERAWELEQERLAECECGAFQLSQGEYRQFADCICGRT